MQVVILTARWQHALKDEAQIAMARQLLKLLPGSVMEIRNSTDGPTVKADPILITIGPTYAAAFVGMDAASCDTAARVLNEVSVGTIWQASIEQVLSYVPEDGGTDFGQWELWAPLARMLRAFGGSDRVNDINSIEVHVRPRTNSEVKRTFSVRINHTNPNVWVSLEYVANKPQFPEDAAKVAAELGKELSEWIGGLANDHK